MCCSSFIVAARYLCRPPLLSALAVGRAGREGARVIFTALHRCTELFDVLVPVRCALCGDHGAHVCASCRARLANAPLLIRPTCADAPPVVALGAYSGSLRAAVLGLKFRNRIAAARELGALLARKLTRDIDVVVAVPLHPRRLRERGFNQADAIAAGIALELEVPVQHDALIRARYTFAQSALALRERGTNVCDAFTTGSNASGLQNARVMLVDDVVTSGATSAACTLALCGAGVTVVRVAALAIKL
jgi:ComF family protein